ncbi:MAG: Yip1 family protein [Pseudomonadales bacterium]|nr:Yip1 family protein [Pseudomonadales bacterium]
MILEHTFGIITQPKVEWQDIHDDLKSPFALLLNHTLILALIPAICWYIGTTQVGWSVGDREAVRLTTESALTLAILFYVGILAGVVILGAIINWMARTYGAESTLAKGIAVATYTATPLFLAGIFGLYPLIWLDFIVGLVAMTASAYLLVSGVPIMMDIPKAQGLLFSAALMAAGMIGIVAMMVASILLWDMGAAPAFV